jgi:nitrogen fixation/metabolism regulation signal transduction histidine kinase
VEKLIKLVLREALGGVAKPAERFMKRVVRAFGLILAGIVIAIIGVGFVSVGAVKWLSVLMPSWLAWVIVGIMLLLIGITVTMTTFASGRS